jgi:hypothetical protein
MAKPLRGIKFPGLEDEYVLPSEYGYGGNAITVQETKITTDDALATALGVIYNAMGDGETKMVRWVGYPSNGFDFFGILERDSINNGGIIAWTAENGGYQISKTKNGGNWQPLEWINPPMVDGVEYRTTKRCNGKPVYTTYMNLGTLPVTDYKNFPYSTEGSTTELISFELFTKNAENEQYAYPHLGFSDAVIKCVARQGGKRTFSIRTFSDMSSYTGTATLEYTKKP